MVNGAHFCVGCRVIPILIDLHVFASYLVFSKALQTNELVSHKTLMSHNYAVSQYKLYVDGKFFIRMTLQIHC